MKARIINTDKIIDVRKIADGRYVSKSNSHIFKYYELDFDDLEVQKDKTVNKIREVIKEYFSDYDAGMNIEKQYAISDFCEEVDNLLRRIKL